LQRLPDPCASVPLGAQTRQRRQPSPRVPAELVGNAADIRRREKNLDAAGLSDEGIGKLEKTPGIGGHRPAAVAEKEKPGLAAAWARPGRKDHLPARAGASAKHPAEMEATSLPQRFQPAASPDPDPGNQGGRRLHHLLQTVRGDFGGRSASQKVSTEAGHPRKGNIPLLLPARRMRLTASSPGTLLRPSGKRVPFRPGPLRSREFPF